MFTLFVQVDHVLQLLCQMFLCYHMPVQVLWVMSRCSGSTTLSSMIYVRTHIICSVSFGTDGNPQPTDELSKCSTDILRWFIGSYIFWDQLLNMCTELIPILNLPLYQTRCFFPCVSCVRNLSVEFRIQNSIQIGQMLGKMKNACQMLLQYIMSL
jgi:hypothetical protein